MSAKTNLKDDGVRWLKFKYDITIEPGRVIPAGTVVLGRLGYKLTLRSIFWDGGGLGWRVVLEDGYSTIFSREVVEAIKPLGLPVKQIPKPAETLDRLETACWITLKTAIEFSPGLGFGTGTRGLGFPVPEGWIMDLAGDRHSIVIPDSEVEVEGPFHKLDDLRWLECEVDVPIREGKFIAAGKRIVGSRVDNGWKAGAEYSDFIEDIWRTREEYGFDNSIIAKVDATPSIIIPDRMVKAGPRARWFDSGHAGKTAPPEIRVKCAEWSDESPERRAAKLVYTGWRLKPKADLVAENGKRFRKGESIGKKRGKVGLWWAGVRTKLFPKGFKWFHTCRYPISKEPRKDCKRLFWGTVTPNTHARGGKLGFCSKHKPIVKAGWARYVEAKRKNRAAWCAKLTYACCVNWFILSTDSRGTFFYVDTREWPEWDSLPESAKRETDVTEKYMLPIAREKWANLCSWQWIGYEKESEELRWIAEHLSTPLKTPDFAGDLKKVNKMIDQERRNEMARTLHPGSAANDAGERALEKMRADFFGDVCCGNKTFASFRAHASTWNGRN